jgi:hypothetical protein
MTSSVVAKIRSMLKQPSHVSGIWRSDEDPLQLIALQGWDLSPGALTGGDKRHDASYRSQPFHVSGIFSIRSLIRWNACFNNWNAIQAPDKCVSPASSRKNMPAPVLPVYSKGNPCPRAIISST